MKELKKIEDKIVDNFEEIKLEKKEIKAILCVSLIKDLNTNIMSVSLVVNGNKIDIVDGITMLLRDEVENDLQSIFIGVKDSI